MNCLSEEQLNRFIDGELSTAELKECNLHLEGCDTCRQKLAVAKKIEAAGEPLRLVVSSIKLNDSVMARIQRESLQPESMPASTTRSVSPLATVLRWCVAGTFFVATGFIVGNLVREPLQTPAHYRSIGSYKATCLSFAASIAGIAVPTGAIIDFPADRLTAISGNFAFAPEPGSASLPAFIWNGQATMGLAENTILWNSGAGDFEVRPGSELKIHLLTHIVVIHAGKLSITGKSGADMTVTLRSGSATLRGKEKPVILPVGQTLTLKNGRVDAIPELEPMTPEQASASLPVIATTSALTDVSSYSSNLQPVASMTDIATLSAETETTGTNASDTSPESNVSSQSQPVVTPFSVQPLHPHGVD